MQPIVGILCTTEEIPLINFGTLGHQAVFQKYISAVVNYAKCYPLLIPTACFKDDELDTAMLNIIKNLHGILLTGGVSNVGVELYASNLEHVGIRDNVRDDYALAAIAAAYSTGKPLLGICRGMQEINVAFGGTLIADLHDQPGRLDHRSNSKLPMEERSLPRHELKLEQDSWFAKKIQQSHNPNLFVNSMHSQGIGSLGSGLVIDAIAADGTVEAISHADADVEIIGVQWHPEWMTQTCELSRLVWDRFGKACWNELNAEYKVENKCQ